MKINGKAIEIREVIEVKLNRTNDAHSIKLKVSGYPIGIRRMYESTYQKPMPPKVPTGVQRVGQKEPETVLNYEDPTYVTLISDWFYFQKFFIIRKCLEVDKDAEFDSDCSTMESIKAFEQELHAAGFSEGDLGVIWDAIEQATKIDPKAVEAAKATFSASLTP